MLGLRFCARAFSSCGERGPLFIAVRGPLTIAASLVAEHRLQTRRLSSCGSVVVAHGPNCSAACGIFPDQGLNPCLLHWQADSQPPRRQGSPRYSFLMYFIKFLNGLEIKKKKEKNGSFPPDSWRGMAAGGCLTVPLAQNIE